MCQGSDSCGCCGVDAAVPEIGNRPGLTTLAYRSGTHATVLRRMVTALTGKLASLDPTAADDPAIALLDSWATVADVVTFYQERIANEGFLRTATERRSVLELARQIGYELRPGVAAATHLDFRMQVPAASAPAPGPAAPTTAVVPAGTKVLSVPAQGKLPQPFETSQQITALAALNELALRTREPQQVTAGLTELYLEGTSTALRPGTAILIVQHADPPAIPATWALRVLDTVESLAATAPDASPATLVGWTDGLAADILQPEVFALDLRGAVFGSNAPAWLTLPDDFRKACAAAYNASLVPAGTTDHDDPQWPGFTLPDPNQPAAPAGAIDLDGVHSEIVAGSFLVLSQPGVEELYRVTNAAPSAREGFAISAKTTYLTLDRINDLDEFDRRQVAVLAASRRLNLTDRPIGGTVGGLELDLALPAPLLKGQPVLITGRSGTTPVVHAGSVANLVTTTLTLADPLSPALDLESVRITGNVVLATHGETVPDEVLGSGDGTVPNQRFTLRKPNLTHVSAGTPSGVADTLEVWVDGVQWREVPSLYQAGPHDRVYVVRIDDDAKATVIFGDGQRGARLPTGLENVHARYRCGIGPDGNVEAHALTVLPKRPLGVASADNPEPGFGGTAPESLDEARTNAPLTVLTIDRVVSLTDYQDYARSFGGIAQAGAVSLPGGAGPTVFITVAGPNGTAVPRQPTLNDLLGALDTVRDRGTTVRAESFVPIRFRLGVQVLSDADRRSEHVRAAVRAVLLTALSPDRRSFGDAVTASQILAAVHTVDGVTAARLTELRLSEPPPQHGDPEVQEVLTAPGAHRDPGDPQRVQPAALLMLDQSPTVGPWTL